MAHGTRLGDELLVARSRSNVEAQWPRDDEPQLMTAPDLGGRLIGHPSTIGDAATPDPESNPFRLNMIFMATL